MPCTAPPARSLPAGRAPLYSRLRQAIRDCVASGEWRPGDQLPTIRQLGELYGVSRITVVGALNDLAREGLLVRWQGKGIFVGQPSVDEPSIPLLSFTEETVSRGQVPGSRALRLQRQLPSPGLAARLSLSADECVVLLERLRLVDGAPFGLHQAYLPDHVVPGLVERDKPVESLYRLLADTYGVLPTRAVESYQAIRLDRDQAALLETEPGVPGFEVERLTSDQHGRTIEFVHAVLRGDRYQLRVQLKR